MSITREEVADLQPGDVVEITSGYWPKGSSVSGPLRVDRDGWLICADFPVRLDNGDPGGSDSDELRFIAQGARLYVNHQRQEPAPGDVVADRDGLIFLNTETPWCSDVETWVGARPSDGGIDWRALPRLARPLRLLVDGSTGQVVP